MAPFVVGEALVLLIGFLGFVPAALDFHESRKLTPFFAGYVALLVGLLATNLEAFAFASEMNVIEHVVGILFASILFLAWAKKNYDGQFLMQRGMEKISLGKK